MTALWLIVICFWTIRSYRPIFENALCTRLVRLLEVCQKTSRLPYLKPVFFKYLISKVNPQLPDIQYLKKCSRFF